jgi:TonB family protein
MRNEREYCSDDIAVKHCGDAIAYAHTLVDTASLCTKAHHHTIPDLAMAASGGDLKQRVIRLVDHHCTPKNNISKWFASIIIVFSVLLLSSKQILTMPLLDIGSNEKHWQHSNNTKKTQKNIIYTDKVMPNGSVAQQLLNPPEDKSNIVRPIDLKTTLISPDLLVQKRPNNMLSVIPLENTSLTTSRSNDLSKEPTNAVSSKVERVFEPILSQNESSSIAQPYQEKMTTLAIVPVTKRAKSEQITTILKSSYSEVLADSSSVNNKKNNLTYTDNKKNIRSTFVDHISRQKEEWVQPVVIENKSIFPITPVWHSAEQVKSVVPIYPSMAKRRGIEMEVKVNFTIDIDGHIKDIRFARHKKINYFEHSIRKAIKKWRFLPAKVDEKPVESQMVKVFSFSLQS